MLSQTRVANNPFYLKQSGIIFEGTSTWGSYDDFLVLLFKISQSCLYDSKRSDAGSTPHDCPNYDAEFKNFTVMVTQHLIFYKPTTANQNPSIKPESRFDHPNIKQSTVTCRQTQSQKVATQQAKADCERNILWDNFDRWGRQICIRNKEFIKAVKTIVLQGVKSLSDFKSITR